MSSTLYDRAREIQPQLTAWRRTLHQYPELGFEELRTAVVVANALRRMGLSVDTGVGGTGVVARLGEGHPAIGLRGDMDALPIHEGNDVPYASRNEGVMHACGHDGNTTILLGAAKLLCEMDDRPKGEIRFLFQPSEENEDAQGKSGAERMIEAGALDGLDAVIGQHVNSLLPVGQIEVASGYVMAAADSFEATIIGKGAHGAEPHTGVDPIYILGYVIQAINGIVARRIAPTRPAVVTIGAVHSGLAGNVIPERVRMVGTIRSYDPETRQALWDELDQAMAITRALGGDYTLHIQPGYPATCNAQPLVELVRQATTDLAGAAALKELEPQMGAEDFSLMSEVVPGAMFMTGVEIAGDTRLHHSEYFDLDESGLSLGVAVMAETACRFLGANR